MVVKKRKIFCYLKKISDSKIQTSCKLKTKIRSEASQEWLSHLQHTHHLDLNSFRVTQTTSNSINSVLFKSMIKWISRDSCKIWLTLTVVEPTLQVWQTQNTMLLPRQSHKLSTSLRMLWLASLALWRTLVKTSWMASTECQAMSISIILNSKGRLRQSIELRHQEALGMRQTAITPKAQWTSTREWFLKVWPQEANRLRWLELFRPRKEEVE